MIDLDSLSDGDVVASQFSGLWFSNATVRTAGVSLNEFEFPPAKGAANVLTDAGGPISIDFDRPIHSFSGRFTYDVPLVLTATGDDGKTVANATSTFSRNLALSGEPGSGPNELIAVRYADGISRVLIEGEPLGTSFTLSDAKVDLPAESDPQERAVMATLAAVALVAGRGRRKFEERSGGSSSSAAPGILVESVSPTLIPVGVPAVLKLTATSKDADLITESLNLTRVNRHGRAIATLTRLIEESVVGGARTFHMHVFLCEPKPGPIRFRISAARRGWLRRLVTGSLTVSAAANVILPPDVRT